MAATRRSTYAEASLAGVEQVAALAGEETIECDLERRPAFTYAADEGELSSVENEAAAAQRAGLDAVLTDKIDLPYAVAGAVRLDDQLPIPSGPLCPWACAGRGRRRLPRDRGHPCARTRRGLAMPDPHDRGHDHC